MQGYSRQADPSIDIKFPISQINLRLPTLDLILLKKALSEKGRTNLSDFIRTAVVDATIAALGKVDYRRFRERHKNQLKLDSPEYIQKKTEQDALTAATTPVRTPKVYGRTY